MPFVLFRQLPRSLLQPLRECSKKVEGPVKKPPPPSDQPLGREIYLDNQVVRLILNSPKNRNALSLELMQKLRGELSAIDKIQKIRAVIIAHEGPAFSGGHDLRELVKNILFLLLTKCHY